MGLKDTLIEGSSKKIVQASPMDISKFRKKYLRSLSPGNANRTFRQSLNEVNNLPRLINDILLKRLSKSRETRRGSSIQMAQKIPRNQMRIIKKPKVRKIVFKECLRLNNL